LALETGAGASVAFHSLSGAYSAKVEHFVVSVVDATSATIYLDGSLLTSVTADVSPPASATRRCRRRAGRRCALRGRGVRLPARIATA
jgi:hypothetical protein